MAARKRTVTKKPMLTREAPITAWKCSFSIQGKRDRDGYGERESNRYLLLFGTFDDPVGKHLNFEVFLTPGDETPRVEREGEPAIGSLLTLRRRLTFFVHLSEIEFATILTLATAERIRSCVLRFEQPIRGRGTAVTWFYAKTELPGVKY